MEPLNENSEDRKAAGPQGASQTLTVIKQGLGECGVSNQMEAT